MGHIAIKFDSDSIEDTASTADSLKEEFEMLESRLLGRADDLSGSYDSAAEQFTEVIGWNIHFRSEEEHQAWVDASTNIRFLIGVCSKWAVELRRFYRVKSEIDSEWMEEKGAKESSLPGEYQYVDASTPSRNILDWDTFDARKRYDELMDVRDDLQERSDRNMENHEDEVEEIAAMFSEGPTEANVNALIEGGHATWGFANIDPETYLEQDHDLTPENAGEVAQELGEYWSGNKPVDARYHELMLFMGMLSTHAMYAQGGNTEMDEDEMEFLDSFYEALEEEHEDGVLGYRDTLDDEHLDEDDRADALGIMGDGLLILSDERLGGSYDSLPASVRSAAEGSDLTTVTSDHDLGSAQRDWLPKAEALESLFNHSNKRLEGGAELSTTLMHTVSQEISRFTLPGFSTEDGALDGLLSTATRNEDANYAILTGEYPDDLVSQLDETPGLPWTEETKDAVRSNIIENIYTHDWPDDGNAARGLTEWIEDDAWSDSEDKREMAAEAMIGLMETITTQEMHEALSATGNSVELDDGTKLNNASFGAVNPGIADGFAHLFELYIDSFASEEGIDKGQVDFGWNGNPTWNDDQREFESAPADRLIFLEYIMGDEDAAVRAHTASSAYAATQLEIHIDEGTLEGGATRGSIAQFMVDSSLNNELINRGLGEEEHDAAQKNIAEKVSGVGSNALGLAPGIGSPLSQASDIVSSELINSAFQDQQSLSPHVSSHTPETLIEYHTSLRVLEEILENNDGELPEIEEGSDPKDILQSAGVLTGTNSSGYGISSSPTASSDAPSSSQVMSAIELYLKSDDAEGFPGTNVHSSEFSNDFYDTFNQTYRDLGSHLRYGEGDIENLYNRIEAS